MNKNRVMIYLWAWLLDFELLMDNRCTLLDGKDIDQQLMQYVTIHTPLILLL